MTRLLLPCAFAGLLAAQSVPVRTASTATTDNPHVSRPVMKKLEETFDRTIARLNVDDPFDLLGNTRGIYLRGYGALFTAEVNLVITPVDPFHPQPDKNGIARLRLKKLQRYETLKKTMRQMLVDSAYALEEVPRGEQIAFGMWLLYKNFEDRAGLPGQVLMFAPRQALLDFKANRIDEAALQAAVRLEEN
jgi:hypothetical protein